MPLSLSYRDDLVDRFGEFVYHFTTTATVRSLLAGNSLRPATEDERRGNWHPMLRPRPGCLYFWVPVTPRLFGKDESTLRRKATLRTRWSALTPLDCVLVEEDMVASAIESRAGASADVPPFTAHYTDPPRALLMPAEPEISPDWVRQPVEKSWGEWVDEVDQDTPENVYASARRGAVAFRGELPVRVLDLNVACLEARRIGELLGPGGRSERWFPLTNLLTNNTLRLPCACDHSKRDGRT